MARDGGGAMSTNLWASLRRNAEHVFQDFAVVCMWLGAIWVVGYFDRFLYPPEGLIFFPDLPISFKAKWLLHAAEAGNLAIFLLRSMVSVARGAT